MYALQLIHDGVAIVGCSPMPSSDEREEGACVLRAACVRTCLSPRAAAGAAPPPAAAAADSRLIVFPSTQIYFLFERYSIVFALDVRYAARAAAAAHALPRQDRDVVTCAPMRWRSPSLFSAHTGSTSIPIDDTVASIEVCLLRAACILERGWDDVACVSLSQGVLVSLAARIQSSGALAAFAPEIFVSFVAQVTPAVTQCVLC